MTMQRRAILLTAAATGLGATSTPGLAQAPANSAAPAELASEWPTSQLQGQGRLTFMTLQVYDARLWTNAKPVGADWGASLMALELIYARGLRGAKIAERSLTEMQRQGDIAVLKALGASTRSLIRDALGPVTGEFLKFKRMEWIEYMRHVSEWEVKQYLEFF